MGKCKHRWVWATNVLSDKPEKKEICIYCRVERQSFQERKSDELEKK